MNENRESVHLALAYWLLETLDLGRTEYWGFSNLICSLPRIMFLLGSVAYTKYCGFSFCDLNVMRLMCHFGFGFLHYWIHLKGWMLHLYVAKFFSILLTHKRSHREVYQDFQPSLTSSAGGAKVCSDHRFRAPPAYTAQLPTLHQHRANNQYRTANQIKPTLRVSSSTQATLGTVAHPSTNRAQRCLTSVIVRELVFPSW